MYNSVVKPSSPRHPSMLYAWFVRLSVLIGIGLTPRLCPQAQAFDLRYFPNTQQVELYRGEEKLSFSPPRGVTQLQQAGNMLYMLAPGQNLLHILPLDDLTFDPSTTFSQAFDLNELLPEHSQAIDLAAYQAEDFVYLYVTFKSPQSNGQAQEIEALPIVVRQGDDLDDDDQAQAQWIKVHSKATEHLAKVAEVDGVASEPTAEGFWVMVGEPVRLLGQGKVVALRDPTTGGAALLSLDLSAAGIHLYQLPDPYRPAYKTSFSLPANMHLDSPSGEAQNDQPEASLAGDQLSIPAKGPEVRSGVDFIDARSQLFSFALYDADSKERSNLSLIALQRQQSQLAAHVQTQAIQEIYGNTWTKAFMGLGLFSSLIDALDHMVKNPQLSTEELTRLYPNLKTFIDNSDVEALLEWSKQEGLLTVEQASDLKVEYELRKFGGRKWFIYALIACGALEFYEKINAPRLWPALRKQAGRLYQAIEKLIRQTPLMNAKREAQLARWKHSFERMIPNFRRTLVKNQHKLKTPSSMEHIQKKLRSQLNRLYKQHNLDERIPHSRLINRDATESFEKRRELYKLHINKAEQLLKDSKPWDFPEFIKQRVSKRTLNALRWAYGRGVLENPLLSRLHKEAAQQHLLRQIKENHQLLDNILSGLEAEKKLKAAVHLRYGKPIARMHRNLIKDKRGYGFMSGDLSDHRIRDLFDPSMNIQDYILRGRADKIGYMDIAEEIRRLKRMPASSGRSDLYDVITAKIKEIDRYLKECLPRDCPEHVPTLDELLALDNKSIRKQMAHLQTIAGRIRAQQLMVNELRKIETTYKQHLYKASLQTSWMDTHQQLLAFKDWRAMIKAWRKGQQPLALSRKEQGQLADIFSRLENKIPAPTETAESTARAIKEAFEKPHDNIADLIKTLANEPHLLDVATEGGKQRVEQLKHISDDLQAFLRETRIDEQGRKITTSKRIAQSNPALAKQLDDLNTSLSSSVRQARSKHAPRLRDGHVRNDWVEFVDKASKLIQHQLELQRIKKSLSRQPENPISMFFAQLSSRYSWYMLSTEQTERLARAAKRHMDPQQASGVGDWLAHNTIKYAIPGVIPDGRGGFVKLQARTTDVNRAMWAWMFESVVDNIGAVAAFNQHEDPRARGIGSTESHIKLIPHELNPFSDEDFGVHYELVSRYIHNTFNWWVRMPTTFARYDPRAHSPFIIGPKGQTRASIPLMQQEWNRMVKTLHPLNLFRGKVLETYLPREATKSWVFAQYETEHAGELKTQQGQEDYQDFRDRVNRRTDFNSYVFMQSFSLMVKRWANDPQYQVREYAQQFVRKLTGSHAPDKIIEYFIIPYTAAYALRWENALASQNYPALKSLLSFYGLESILGKIDAEGYTDIASWSGYEKVGFFQLMFNLEIGALEEELPMPEATDSEALAAWFALLQQRMFGSEKHLEELMAQMGSDDSTLQTRVQLIREPQSETPGDSDAYSLDSDPLEADHSDQQTPSLVVAARKLLKLFQKWQNHVRFLPTTGPLEPLNVEVSSWDQQDALYNLQRVLNDATSVNDSIQQALKALSSNQGSLDSWNAAAQALSTSDTLFLFAAFFGDRLNVKTLQSIGQVSQKGIEYSLQKLPTLSKLLDGLKALPLNKHVRHLPDGAQTIATLKNLTRNRRVIYGGVLLTLIGDRVFRDQRQAHASSQAIIGGLLVEMQQLMLATSTAVMAELQALRLQELSAQELEHHISDYRQSVDARLELIEVGLEQSYSKSRHLVQSRNQRWFRVYSEFGPILTVFTAGFWGVYESLAFATRNWGGRSLPKSIRGYFGFLLKLGLLSTVATTATAQNIEASIQADTADFFAFYTAYSSVRTEAIALRIIEDSLHRGEDIPEDFNEQVQEHLHRDELLNNHEIMTFRKELLCAQNSSLAFCAQH